MAQRVQVLMTDDLDESEATETVQFGLDGVAYEIDLNDENATELRNLLNRYSSAGRRINRRGPARKSSTAAGGRATGSEVDSTAVRAWARENGHEVSDRGRIKSEILQAYKAAGN